MRHPPVPGNVHESVQPDADSRTCRVDREWSSGTTPCVNSALMLTLLMKDKAASFAFAQVWQCMEPATSPACTRGLYDEL